MKYSVYSNKGAQLGVHNTKVDADKAAAAVNAKNSSVFAWVVPESNPTVEDLPGRGFIYG